MSEIDHFHLKSLATFSTIPFVIYTMVRMSAYTKHVPSFIKLQADNCASLNSIEINN